MAEKCPGIYCGRIQYNSTAWSECGACPRGYRSFQSKCIPCDSSPSAYDWLYLGFTMLMPLIMHWFFINSSLRKKSIDHAQNSLILHISALIEIVAAALLVIVFVDPTWSFQINSCGVTRLADWYTLFHNPSPNYEDTLYCTQEAVYPLQTIVLLFYLLGLVFMMLFRPILCHKYKLSGGQSIYSALYFYPILALLHSIAGGLIYYSFPYLCIIISMISNACHFSVHEEPTMKSLIINTVKEAKNAVILVGHWMILAYGIISLQYDLRLLGLVPMPAVFYIITVTFTDPKKFRDDRN